MVKTFNIYRKDYTDKRWVTVYNFILLATKDGDVMSYEEFKNYLTITCANYVYEAMQELINN